MQWADLTDENGWQQILQRSKSNPVLLFKHSSRCSLSSIVKYRLDDFPWTSKTDAWFLDVIQYRALSRQIARELDMIHESPQVLIIHGGICEWDEDHLEIQGDEVNAILQSLVNEPS
ncbi:MAG: bacillithiol system redox-active protein YtxJ [Saprospiraceae bacterium]|nr:bacillithiol system redox-active protein YtxJ [Saprospiraceae bacterium]